MHCICVANIDVFIQIEDEQEKFERLQKSLLLENPESAAFYNAKLRIQRRVSNNDFDHSSSLQVTVGVSSRSVPVSNSTSCSFLVRS